MKSTQIKNEILILEEKLKNLIETGKMTVIEFSNKTKSNQNWVYPWRAGKKNASYEKILDMAKKLEM